MTQEQAVISMQPMFLLIFLIFGIIVLRLLLIHQKYKKSDYKNVSGNNFLNTVFNKGNYGEFLTFVMLEKLDGDKKILTNVYIPKDNGETTEIDLLMINETGIYVFESKNYSGWIFGDENIKNWTQTLKGGKKNKFFNPVIQNKGHIKALQNIMKDINKNIFYSYIVFSERCELKKVSVKAENVVVLKRDRLTASLKKDLSGRKQMLEKQQIDQIYELLKKYTLATDEVKAKHIEAIRNKK